jgi:hypothetical protein
MPQGGTRGFNRRRLFEDILDSYEEGLKKKNAAKLAFREADPGTFAQREGASLRGLEEDGRGERQEMISSTALSTARMKTRGEMARSTLRNKTILDRQSMVDKSSIIRARITEGFNRDQLEQNRLLTERRLTDRERQTSLLGRKVISVPEFREGEFGAFSKSGESPYSFDVRTNKLTSLNKTTKGKKKRTSSLSDFDF